MASIKVAVNGATGKMGREVVAALCREPDMEPVGAVCKQERGANLSLPDGSGSIPLSTSLDEVLRVSDPKVLVDFTNAEVSMAAAPVAAEHSVNLVIGSTGLSEADHQELDRISKEQSIGIIVAPNFALGAVLLIHLARQAAPFFEYIDIIETHHEAKMDAPSGTALAMARAIAQGRQYKRNYPEKEPLPGTRGGEYNGVGIHSIRMAGRSAHHEVIMGAAGQTISLRHDTLGRDCYMPGVLRAIREVVNIQGLVVGLDKILGL